MLIRHYQFTGMATLLKTLAVFLIHPKKNSFSDGWELTRSAWNTDVVPIDALSIDIFRLLTAVAKPTTVPIWLYVYVIPTERRVFPRLSNLHFDCIESVMWYA